MPTATGYRDRIIAWAAENGRDDISPSRAMKVAIRVHRRAQRMHEEFDFYEALRILGMSSDTTARDAITPRTTPTRHINDRLPSEPLMQEAAA